MVLARALFAWTVVFMRSISGKRIAMEHENLLREKKTPMEIEG
tara:strand:+ start:3832 stop:3960 length:129 start_codon:yes stop_codon:yes gene_type:complete